MGYALFSGRIRGTPASLTLVQQPLYQSAIGVWRLAVTFSGIPMMALFVVALRVCQAKIQEFVTATQAAWMDMLDIGPEAGLGVETQAPAADQALAHPEAVSVTKGGVGSRDLVFLACRHDLLAQCSAL